MENSKEIVAKRAFRNLVKQGDEIIYNSEPYKKKYRRKNKEPLSLKSVFKDLNEEFAPVVLKNKINVSLNNILGERLGKFSFVEKVEKNVVYIRCKNKMAYLNYKMQKDVFLEKIAANVGDFEVEDVVILPPQF